MAFMIVCEINCANQRRKNKRLRRTVRNPRPEAAMACGGNCCSPSGTLLRGRLYDTLADGAFGVAPSSDAMPAPGAPTSSSFACDTLAIVFFTHYRELISAPAENLFYSLLGLATWQQNAPAAAFTF